MSSFLKIASGTLLPLALALGGAGCLAASGDESAGDEAVIGESALFDQASTTPPATTQNCGPGNLIGSLPYPLPVGPGYYGSYYGAPYYGGVPYYGGAPYYGAGFPAYSGYYGYGGGYYPGYYGTPAQQGTGNNNGCGCPPSSSSP